MVIGSYLIGLGIGIASLSLGEWLIHKHLLHAPKSKRKWFNRASSVGHNDVHHRAYKGPAHYYRDVTNENEVIHFDAKSVMTLIGGGTALGLVTNRLFSLASGNSSFGYGDAAYVAGMTSAVTIGYLGYEVSHHYMHVIGERRLHINRLLGDKIQGGERHRDGKLRYSKPLLDDICNSAEEFVDSNIKAGHTDKSVFRNSLVKRLEEQTQFNLSKGGVQVTDISLSDVLEQTARETLQREEKIRANLDLSQRLSYFVDRKIQRLFRGSDSLIGKYFRVIDNHHFSHHSSYLHNLNVFWLYADNLFGTKIDSSVKKLEDDKSLWLCPNSPDAIPFHIKNNVTK